MNKLSQELQQTIQQIRELAARREDYIRRTGLTLSIKHSCNKLGMYPTTVKQLAPELYKNWK